MIRAWLVWTGRPEAEYWRATPAEAARAIRAGRTRRDLLYRDLACAARLGQAAERSIERYLPRIDD